MKKIVITIICIILCVSCSAIFVACNDWDKTPDDNNTHTEEPSTEEPGTEEPGTEEPGTEEPGTEEPSTEEPGTEEPSTEEPGTEEPGTIGLEYRTNPDLKSYSVIGIGETTSSNIIIPETYNDLLVTTIGEYAFEGITGLESIKLPKTIVDIGQFAFHNCSELKDIGLSEGLVSIQNGAFQGCSSLTDISLPASITYIGGGWIGCNNLNAIYIQDISQWLALDFSSGNLQVSYNLYVNNELVTDLIIPEGIETIGTYAFAGCISLESIRVPTSLKTIKAYAFWNCTSLTAIYIEDLKSWCSIDFESILSSIANPLYYAKDLYLNNELVTQLVIPNGITAINDYAFMGCTSIKSVRIPNSIESIGRNAFIECSSLEAVYVDEISSWCSIIFKSTASNPLFYAKKLFLQDKIVESLEIPASVSKVSDYAFISCTSIKRITISKSCVRIGYSAFAACNFVENVIFENVYGWTVGTEAGGNMVSYKDLGNSKKAAAYLTQTYFEDFWKCW